MIPNPDNFFSKVYRSSEYGDWAMGDYKGKSFCLYRLVVSDMPLVYKYEDHLGGLRVTIPSYVSSLKERMVREVIDWITSMEAEKELNHQINYLERVSLELEKQNSQLKKDLNAAYTEIEAYEETELLLTEELGEARTTYQKFYTFYAAIIEATRELED